MWDGLPHISPVMRPSNVRLADVITQFTKGVLVPGVPSRSGLLPVEGGGGVTGQTPTDMTYTKTTEELGACIFTLF